MPFKHSKLTDESPSFFLLQSLEFSKILLYYDNIKPGAAAGGQVKKISLNPKINLDIKIILPTFV